MPEPQPADLVGVWRLVERTTGGRNILTATTHVVFREDGQCWEVPGGEPRLRTTWSGEGDRIDQVQQQWAEDGTQLQSVPSHGRWRRDRNLLILAWAAMPGMRPVSVDSDHGERLVLQRELDPAVVARCAEPPGSRIE